MTAQERTGGAGQPRHSKNVLRRALAVLGPGLTTGAADDDPAGIVTDTQAGAQFQYAFAWTALIQFPLVAALQIMVSRIGLVTGRDFTRVLGEHYPRAFLWVACTLLLVANTFTAGADLAGVGAAVQLVTRIPARLVAALAAVGLATILVFGHYRVVARTLKWLTLALIGYVFAGILAAPNWMVVARQTFLPHVTLSRDYLSMLVAVFGGTISPYMLVWQSAQEVEELSDAGKRPLRRRPRAARRDLRHMREDTIAGMAISQCIEYFVFIAAGSAIFPTGLRTIETAQQAATALHTVGRGAGEILFAVAMIGTGLLAVPTLTASSAYAVADAARWRASINAPASSAKGFNSILALGLLAAGGIAVLGRNAMRLLVASQVLNGILAAPLLLMVLKIANDRRVLGTHTNGLLINALGVVAFLFMAIPAIWLLGLSVLR
jgi:NRAMP (natural resistance-associated macrophage protein)-like metal ion transporter